MIGHMLQQYSFFTIANAVVISINYFAQVFGLVAYVCNSQELVF